MFIILTPEQADQVRGDYGSSRLEPRQVGEVYILGLSVLTDPAFASVHEVLAALRQGEVVLPNE